jgi:hypothetical protein
MDRRQRTVGANYVAMQGKRFLPIGMFLLWLAGGYGEWLPAPGVEHAWARIAGFGLAFAMYWIVGWWSYTRRYGKSRGSVPNSIGELAPWIAAVAMMTTALCGERPGLTVLLVSLVATSAGAVTMGWILFGEFSNRPRTHGICLLSIIMVAALLQTSSPGTDGQASMSLSLAVMGIGFLIAGPVDSFRLSRSFDLLSGRT